MTAALTVALGLYAFIFAFDVFLELLNVSHLKKSGGIAPPEFAGSVDADFLERAGRYHADSALLGIFASAMDAAAVIVFFGALLGAYGIYVSSFRLPFILAGAAFFIPLYWAQLLLSIPFSMYRTFRIERKYGFNTMTSGLWAADLVKSAVISTALLALLIIAALAIVQMSPQRWWLWIWAFLTAFGVFMMYLSPYVIEPLFNKFEPLEDATLAHALTALAARAGIRVDKVLMMDASRRTRHTNAYFTGIGRAKRIVLFDTLIKNLSREELLAVVAHEAGHWKKRHLLRRMLTAQAVMLASLYIAYTAMKGDMLNGLFGITGGSFFTKALIASFIGSIAAYPAGFVSRWTSRRHEKEADMYAVCLTGDKEGLVRSLIKLSKDNLSNPNPHPLYSSLKYSHPAVRERIRYVRGR